MVTAEAILIMPVGKKEPQVDLGDEELSEHVLEKGTVHKAMTPTDMKLVERVKN